MLSPLSLHSFLHDRESFPDAIHIESGNGHLAVVEYLINYSVHSRSVSNQVDTFNPDTCFTLNVPDKISVLKAKKIIPRYSDKTCNICLDDQINDKNMTIVPCCRQIFCDDCLSKTITTQNCCPLCRNNNFQEN
jgi:hypothetical protein